jgi:hypothetical protein
MRFVIIVTGNVRENNLKKKQELAISLSLHNSAVRP